MPIYEYECKLGHRFEQLVLAGDKVTLEIPCQYCKEYAVKRLSCPNFKLSWVPVVVDNAKDIWDGTPLEGTDGINEVQYKSDKIFVDQGKTG